tara:strand:- start:42 stop:365 length:324 start_codon:yes stop_codon:yes gene_type:complete
MNDIECPYCGHEQEVCHDDGQGYEEDRYHEMECYECEKSFVFTTSVQFYYSPQKADCLNGNEHELRKTTTVPRRYTKMACTCCDYERPLTDSEREELGEEYQIEGGS